MLEYDETMTMKNALYHTLSLQVLNNMLKDVFSMFSKDLVMKKLVIDQIQNTHNRNTLVMYTYSWMESPMIRTKEVEDSFEIIENEMSIYQNS